MIFLTILMVTHETKYLRMEQIKFVEDHFQNPFIYGLLKQTISLQKIPQILLGPFLNTLSQIHFEVPD